MNSSRASSLQSVIIASAIVSLICCASVLAGDKFIAGADISMLPEIEKAGGVFRENGKPGDAIAILTDHGCNLFRIRLFVNPTHDYAKSWGATQDLDYVRALAKRVKGTGQAFLLDFHYSDTWADPAHQITPAAWKNLDFEAMKKQVGDYTTAVLGDLRDDGCLPDMVQVGNEVTAGVLWPMGKVLDAPPASEARQWERFAELVNAGSKAVRGFDTPGHKIRIVLHIHGGGRVGLPKWFFEKFSRTPVDYDIVGLSFYPAWGDSIDALKQNMKDVVEGWGKDILLAETSYPWHEMEGIDSKAVMNWPLTPAGQAQFIRDLSSALREVPGHHGLGFVWWYPEAVQVKGMAVWRKGAEAVFDDKGDALPVLDVFREVAGGGR